MTFIVRMTPPNGIAEYLPENFGFGTHSHTLEYQHAERFPTQAKAIQRMNRYRWPDSYWVSERQHAEQMIEKFKNWNFEVIPA